MGQHPCARGFRSSRLRLTGAGQLPAVGSVRSGLGSDELSVPVWSWWMTHLRGACPTSRSRRGGSATGNRNDSPFSHETDSVVGSTSGPPAPTRLFESMSGGATSLASDERCPLAGTDEPSDRRKRLSAWTESRWSLTIATGVPASWFHTSRGRKSHLWVTLPLIWPGWHGPRLWWRPTAPTRGGRASSARRSYSFRLVRRTSGSCSATATGGSVRPRRSIGRFSSAGARSVGARISLLAWSSVG